MNLSIVIVNWNTRELLAQCLRSIEAYPPEGTFEVFVVDNASTDGSVAMLREQFPQAQVLENDHNPGFAAANNQAIALSSGDLVLLLNPDTILSPGALSALQVFMAAHPDAGAAGSMLLNPDGTLQPSCYPAPTLSREMWRLFHLDRVHPVAEYPLGEWPHDRAHPVDTVQGASLIIRRKVIDEIGPLDESYFMYSEEVDWCLRARSAGWQIYWVPESQVIHFGSQSTRQVATPMFLQLYQAKLHYFRKHFGRGYGTLYKGELFLASSARLMIMPLAWLVQPDQRGEHIRRADHYGRLIRALPGM